MPEALKVGGVYKDRNPVLFSDLSPEETPWQLEFFHADSIKHALTAEGLIKKADAAMYRAKELSKNSIKVAI